MATPKPTHTPKNGTLAGCQSSHSSAESTGKPGPTFTRESGKTAPTPSTSKPAASAAAKQSQKTGNGSSSKPSEHTAGVAPAVAKKSQPSSPSTTQTGAGPSSAKQGCADGGSTNGSESADSHATDTKSSASIATAPKASAGPARTSGPWPLTVLSGDRYELTVITAQGNHYATTFDPTDARLIAAAPDLLAALSHLFDCLPGEYRGLTIGGRIFPTSDVHAADFNAALDKARAAILRATGGK